MRNILGQANLWTTTTELSDLAEGTLQAMYSHINAELQIEYGTPLDRDSSQKQTTSTDERTDVNLSLAKFVVIGMGKFGGRELNFSADLDLMFVYSAEGETTQGTPNADYFSRLGLELVNRMKGNTGGGGIYELDLTPPPIWLKWIDCIVSERLPKLLRQRRRNVGASGTHPGPPRCWGYRIRSRVY